MASECGSLCQCAAENVFMHVCVHYSMDKVGHRVHPTVILCLKFVVRSF